MSALTHFITRAEAEGLVSPFDEPGLIYLNDDGTEIALCVDEVANRYVLNVVDTLSSAGHRAAAEEFQSLFEDE